MTLALLAALPWVALLLYGASVRRPRPLPPGRGAGEDAPRVSVVVPARNEEETIGECLSSLVRSRYPRFEVVVVDDRSQDGTARIARSVDRGRAERVVVVDGEPLPDGWLGKPWACWQGYGRARGGLLLFTDADTAHGPGLLERAVASLEEDGVAAVSVVGRQRLEGFWEKVVQPQIFALMALRFPDLVEPIGPGRCGDALASGQFVLVRRDAYETVGGHRALRGEVVEDLRLARNLCGAGYRLSIREATDALSTRMYRSLSHMVEGWSKNLAIGSALTLPPRMRRVAPPFLLLAGALLWLLPPAALLAWLLGFGGSALGLWSGATVAVSVAFWGAVAGRLEIAPTWGLLYPLGSAVGAFIFARSWLRGTTVEWKGRTYEVADPREG